MRGAAYDRPGLVTKEARITITLSKICSLTYLANLQMIEAQSITTLRYGNMTLPPQLTTL
jgi:hypothetical protein